MQAASVETDSVSSSIDGQIPSTAAAPDTRGKHRILAELKRLEQEARSLEAGQYWCTSDPTSSLQRSSSILINSQKECLSIQGELEELERTDRVSAACQEYGLNFVWCHQIAAEC
ncbi:uncharacterized protein LOC131232466 isoform X2 [Magnolia sinica]|uniref:uncharacterized protein LOC131232466 isoform X2 n=1 Tax=Magnolia sinica TaxID=86752 RepID=UPI00265A0A71|nr:uncharacterized protein LOC131232466 isoform X2 [Magnolia sinica]